MAKSIKKNTILSILKTCASIIYPLITFPYVSRVLLPDNVGKVNFAQSFVSYFSLIAMLGVTTYAIRECAAVKNDKDLLSKTASEIISINMCAAIVAYSMLFISIVFFRKLDPYRTLIVIESFSIICSVLGADWLNSAMEDFKYITIRTIAAQVIAIIAMFLVVRSKQDYTKYAIICVVSASGANLLNIWYRKRYCKITFSLDIDWKKHLPPIMFLFVMMLAQTILNNTDVTMLGLIRNDYEVGLYSTAHKVTKLISSIVQAVAFVIIPRLSLYFSENDFKNANIVLRKVLLFNISLGLPLVVGVEMMAEDIIFVVGGKEFAAATPVIRVLILSFLFSLVGGSFLGNAILIPMKQERYYMIVCIITALCNVALNAVLIPSLGAVGASIATAFNGLIILILLSIKVDKRIKIPNIKDIFVAPLLGCLAIAICCWLSSYIDWWILRIISSVGTSIIGYGIILLLCRNEFAIEIIKSIKGRKRIE